MACVLFEFFQCNPSFTPIVSEVMGRLDHLVEAVYDRFKDRYFKGESMLALFLIILCPYQISRNRRRHIRNEVSLTDIQP